MKTRTVKIIGTLQVLDKVYRLVRQEQMWGFDDTVLGFTVADDWNIENGRANAPFFITTNAPYIVEYHPGYDLDVTDDADDTDDVQQEVMPIEIDDVTEELTEIEWDMIMSNENVE